MSSKECLQHQNLLGRHPPRRREVLVEPHPLADGVIRGPLRHEDPRSATAVGQPALVHVADRPAHRVTVDPKPRRQLRLGREPIAGGVFPRGDVMGQGGGDGFPDRSTGHVAEVSHIQACASGRPAANTCLVV